MSLYRVFIIRFLGINSKTSFHCLIFRLFSVFAVSGICFCLIKKGKPYESRKSISFCSHRINDLLLVVQRPRFLRSREESAIEENGDVSFSGAKAPR